MRMPRISTGPSPRLRMLLVARINVFPGRVLRSRWMSSSGLEIRRSGQSRLRPLRPEAGVAGGRLGPVAADVLLIAVFPLGRGERHQQAEQQQPAAGPPCRIAELSPSGFPCPASVGSYEYPNRTDGRSCGAAHRISADANQRTRSSSTPERRARRRWCATARSRRASWSGPISTGSSGSSRSSTCSGSCSESGPWSRPSRQRRGCGPGTIAPCSGVPIALKDSVDLAGELTTHGTDAFPEPVAADSEMVRRLREAGAIVIGKTLLPELAICGFTESATWGVSRNPWNPQRSTGRLQRRQRRSGGRRHGPAGLGIGRRRLDPHPRRLLRDLRAEAAAGADLPGSRPRATGTGCRSTAASAAPCSTRRSSSTSPPAARASRAPRRSPSGHSPRRPGPRPESCGSRPRRRPPGPRCRRSSATTSSGPWPRPASLLASAGHQVAPRDPDLGQVGNNVVTRYLRGIHDDVERVPYPAAARAADAWLRSHRRALLQRAAGAGAARGCRRTRPGSTRSSSASTC